MNSPYKQLPQSAFWSKSVRDVAPAEVDPVGDFQLKIDPRDKIATAGSCFAQHIAQHLSRSGFNYYVAEPPHPILYAKAASNRQYGLFSARYGNIYTSRQLHQLLLRAYSQFYPHEDCWLRQDGRVIDPFRPSIEPNGFASESEMRADRSQHLAAVRRMIETLDVFIFTLGLTESWISRHDGAVFPICPGVEGGTFDPEIHAFHNLAVDEVVSDMRAVIALVHSVNPDARFILTVSPVPLAATARAGSHVLASTTYSKAVLRVAADMLSSEREVYYFPSYEIITGAHARGAYFAPDLRNVTEAGVDHVMRIFLKHATCDQAPAAQTAVAPDTIQREAERWIEVMCDEEKLDRS